ncbi:MFS transporter, partial [Candidatus Izimaplasma bacterium]|nr:MFS transporter [Candidatus Izimaplasma bacterium]
MSTNVYRKNIKLDLIHTFLRSLNFTHGIWYVYLIFQGFTYFEVGIFETIFHITSLSMEVPTGIVADLYGRKVSRVLGILSYFIYVLILIFSTNIILISIAFIFCGLSFTFESGSGEALVYDSMKLSGEEKNFMKFLGKKEILYQIASTIALFIGGWIALTSYKIDFWLVLIGFTAALMVILLMKETPLNMHKKTKKVSKLLYEHFIISSKTVFSNKRLTFLIIIGALVSAPITSLFFLVSDHVISNLGYSNLLLGIFLGSHAAAGAIGGYVAYKLENRY